MPEWLLLDPAPPGVRFSYRLALQPGGAIATGVACGLVLALLAAVAPVWPPALQLLMYGMLPMQVIAAVTAAARIGHLGWIHGLCAASVVSFIGIGAWVVTFFIAHLAWQKNGTILLHLMLVYGTLLALIAGGVTDAIAHRGQHKTKSS